MYYIDCDILVCPWDADEQVAGLLTHAYMHARTLIVDMVEMCGVCLVLDVCVEGLGGKLLGSK